VVPVYVYVRSVCNIYSVMRNDPPHRLACFATPARPCRHCDHACRGPTTVPDLYRLHPPQRTRQLAKPKGGVGADLAIRTDPLYDAPAQIQHLIWPAPLGEFGIHAAEIIQRLGRAINVDETRSILHERVAA